MTAIIIKYIFDYNNIKIEKSSLIRDFNINRDVYFIYVQITIVRIQNYECISMR